jgi:hypothetical protein
VRVTCSQDVLRGQDAGGSRTTSYFEWYYVLGTGGTWKGTIGKLLVCVPADANVSLPRAFAPLGVHGSEQVFLARDCKPAAGNVASLKRSEVGSFWPGYYEEIWFGKDAVSAKKPMSPAQDLEKCGAPGPACPTR